MRSQVKSAKRLVPDKDLLLNIDGTFALVEKVQRARGRKPRKGETLYVFTVGGMQRINSTAPVRVVVPDSLAPRG